MLKYIISKSTACGDTTKTMIDTITLPQGTKSILGVFGYACGGPGLTTLENVTGIIELESTDLNLQPMQIPLDPVMCLTGGTPSQQIHTWPLNVAGGSGAKINAYITMDMAQTVANTGRVGLVIDVG
jgi:hypothetical protein